MNEMRLKLELDLTITPDQKIIVNSVRQTPILSPQNILITVANVSHSTFKYGVISYGAKSELAELLKSGDKIKVKYKDFLISVNIGDKKGRLTSLTNIVNRKQFQDEFNEGDDIELHFDNLTKIIELKRP